MNLADGRLETSGLRWPLGRFQGSSKGVQGGYMLFPTHYSLLWDTGCYTLKMWFLGVQERITFTKGQNPKDVSQCVGLADGSNSHDSEKLSLITLLILWINPPWDWLISRLLIRWNNTSLTVWDIVLDFSFRWSQSHSHWQEASSHSPSHFADVS